MARCARKACNRWRPDALVSAGRVGVSFNRRWYCSTKCLEADARSAINEACQHAEWVSPPAPRLGRLLVQRRAVTGEALDAALQAQRGSGRRLGAELIAMHAASQEQVLTALAAQAGCGCLLALDPERVLGGPGGLTREIIRVLGVVPFDIYVPQQRLAVACRSPLPGGALAALREMTGWQVQPYMVPDAVHEQLIEAYGRARPHPAPAGDAVRTVPAAAASIARAAQRGMARRMHQVRCDRFVWVRLEGEARSEDFMVALDQPQERQAWQAAPTQH